MTKIWRFFFLPVIIILLNSLCFAQNHTESLSITTYYPSPYGVYRNLKLNPTNVVPSGTALSPGVMYYNSTNNVIRYWNNAVWVNLTEGVGGNSLWMENTTTHFINNTNSGVRVGIGMNAPAERLEVNGNIRAINILTSGSMTAASMVTPGSLTAASMAVSGGVTAATMVASVSMTAPVFFYSSDRSLKKNIRPLSNSLEKLSRLQGMSFQWKSDSRKDLGLIAQDVEKVYPELVSTDRDSGLKSVEYGNLIAVLIEAVKEQQKGIQRLEAEVTQLKKRK